MTIEITKIRVLTERSGPDIIWFTTNLPEGCFPYNGTATLEMRVAHGSGSSYVRSHFGIEPELVGFERGGLSDAEVL